LVDAVRVSTNIGYPLEWSGDIQHATEETFFVNETVIILFPRTVIQLHTLPLHLIKLFLGDKTNIPPNFSLTTFMNLETVIKNQFIKRPY
jgi:hypothetical protein